MTSEKFLKKSMFAKERLARAAEQFSPVLLSYVAASATAANNEQRLGYAIVTSGIVCLRMAAASTWLF